MTDKTLVGRSDSVETIAKRRPSWGKRAWMNFAQLTLDDLDDAKARIKELERMIDRLEMLRDTMEMRIGELEAERDRQYDQNVEQIAYIAKLEKVREASAYNAALQRTRVWEDASMNACGMRGGDSSDVHALRDVEKALAACDDSERAPTFVTCVFTGDPPEGFESWGEWAAHPPYMRVTIAACEDKDKHAHNFCGSKYCQECNPPAEDKEND